MCGSRASSLYFSDLDLFFEALLAVNDIVFQVLVQPSRHLEMFNMSPVMK